MPLCSIIRRKPTGLSLFEASEYLTEILIRASRGDCDARCNGGIGAAAGPRIFIRAVFRGAVFDGTVSIERSSQESETPIPPSDPVFAYLADSPASYGETGSLRQYFRHCAFGVGARDVLELREVYESFADITLAAADAMATAFSMVGSPQGFAVMALGRLGSGEFDLLSDADVLFVCGRGPIGSR